MTLKLIVDALDGVDEPLRALYEPADGKFRLKVDGLEDTAGLKSALQSERKSREAAEKQAKAWGSVGKTPDEIAELLAAQTKAEEDKLNKAGEWDKLRAQMNDKHAVELKARDDKLSAKDKALERFLIDGEATKAIAAAKGVPDLLLPHVQRHVRMVEKDGEYSVIVVDANGPRVNGKGEPLTITDLVSEMKSSDIFGRAFDGTGNSGSGARTSNGLSNGVKTMPRSQFEALDPTARAAKMKEGFTLSEN